MNIFRRCKKEEGQGLVEYALVLVLVAVAIILILTVLGSSVMVTYARVVGGLTGQSITMSGNEYIILNMEANANCPGASCTVTIHQLTFIALQDGQPLENASASLPLMVDGSSTPQTCSTSGDGTCTIYGITVTGSNPLLLTMDNGYRATFP